MKMNTVTPSATPAISSKVWLGLDSRYRRATLRANTASVVRLGRYGSDAGAHPRRGGVQNHAVARRQAALDQGVDRGPARHHDRAFAHDVVGVDHIDLGRGGGVHYGAARQYDGAGSLSDDDGHVD